MNRVMMSMQKKNAGLKNTALASIQNILVTQYNITKNQAYILIRRSKIDQIFDRDAEIAAHTSNKTWARRAYEHLDDND